ncbi:MAG TPA: flagellar hook-associated protein FlgK, partial [Aquabacterium sp.]|nr:flagellar hook-associated protein FlgK [Aquabacterium sp.]
MGTGIYSLGTRAMFASQAMLDTTAHNISNVNTPGYSRQQVELATEGGMYTGAGFFGRGVRVATVTRSTNEFLVKEADRTASLAASDKTRLDKLEQLETTLPTGENGLGYAASQFLNGFVDVANRPQDMSARGVVLSRAQEWVNRVHVAGQQIEQLQAGVVSDMGTTIDQINDYTKQIASLNQDIAKYVGVGHTANDLLDQRDLLVNKLNKLVKVSTVEADDGSLSVFMGGGQLLVLSNQAQTLSLVRDPSNSSLGR